MNALIILFIISYLLYAFNCDLSFIYLYIGLIFVYTVFTQYVLCKTPFNSFRNKTTVSSWGAPNDSHLYGKVKLNVTEIESYLETLSNKLGKKITFTIYSIKLLSIILSKFPELNSYIKYGLLNQKPRVDLCCLVEVGGGQDLCNAVVRNCDNKSIETVYDELNESVVKFRTNNATEHNKKNNVALLLPNFILSLMVQAFSYISSIGIGFKPFGVIPFEFGSCVVTSIGSIGIADGYAPIPPPSFIPLLVSICKKKTSCYYDKDYSIKQKSTISYNFTADFRFISKKTTKAFIEEFKRIGENPLIFEEECKKLEKSINNKASEKN